MYEQEGGQSGSTHPPEEVGEDHRIEFSGRAGEFAGILVINTLLMIVTLGIYRFWGKTRIRRYLWAKTRLYGEPLEYTGTGLELFVGFLIVFLVVILPLGLVLEGAAFLANNPEYATYGFLLFFLFYAVVFYLYGVALFRAHRYRLTRSYWRGIRGGTSEKGWKFGLFYMGMAILDVISLGLASPFTSMRLWNYQYSRSGFGSVLFESKAGSAGLYKPFFVSIALVVIALAVWFAFLNWVGALDVFAPMVEDRDSGSGPLPGELLYALVGLYVALLGLIALIGLAFIFYTAAFYRVALAGMSYQSIRFRMTASTMDWFKFNLGNWAIVIFTLGLGAQFISYRIFVFVSRNLVLIGKPDPATIEQSTQSSPLQGEGLADAFDIGSI